MTIYDEIEAELARALAKYPDCARLPDGTGGAGRRTYETIARNACERAYREGRITHAHIFEEEAAEVLAEEDPVKLRKELVQVAAMCLKWVRDLDGRAAANQSEESAPAASALPDATQAAAFAALLESMLPPASPLYTRLQAIGFGQPEGAIRGTHTHELDDGRSVFCEGSRDKQDVPR